MAFVLGKQKSRNPDWDENQESPDENREYRNQGRRGRVSVKVLRNKNIKTHFINFVDRLNSKILSFSRYVDEMSFMSVIFVYRTVPEFKFTSFYRGFHSD